MTTTDTGTDIKDSLDTIRTYNDFLKKDAYIELINVEDDNDKMYGTIEDIERSLIYDNNYNKDILSKLIYDKFEKALMPTKKTPEEIDSERFKYLKKGDRVLVYEDNINTHRIDEELVKYNKTSYEQYKSIFTETAVRGGNSHYKKYMNRNQHTDDYPPILYKGSVTETGEKYVKIVRDDDRTQQTYNSDGTIDHGNDTTVKRFHLRIIDKTKDIASITLLIYDNKNKIKDRKIIHKIERDPENNENILLHIDGKKYKVKQSPEGRSHILKIKEKIKQSNAKMELGKLKYKLRWNYKTNYSGSKYFPLKVSNIKLLSESEKYSQIDKYIELKEGDIVKYNDSSHKNYGLLAKVVSIGEDTRDAENIMKHEKYIQLHLNHLKVMFQRPI